MFRIRWEARGIMEGLIVALLIAGIAPPIIAEKRGFKWVVWYLYGVILFPVAILHAVFLRIFFSPFTLRRLR